MSSVTQARYSLKQLAFYFLEPGCSGFGGPVALAGYMNTDLVENRIWMTKNSLSLVLITAAGFWQFETSTLVKIALFFTKARQIIMSIASVFALLYIKKIRESCILLAAGIFGSRLKSTF